MPNENRSVNQVKSSAVQAVINFADLTGAGAASPVVSAASVLLFKDNYAYPRDGNTLAVTRNGVGDHTYLFPTAFAAVLDVIVGARGPTSLMCTKASFAIVSGRLQVRVLTFTPAGVATDLTGSDFLRFTIVGNLSNV